LEGIGAGIANTPFFLAAVQGTPAQHSGIASGVVNTALVVGASVGLTSVLGLADLRTARLLLTGSDAVAALNSGYHLAFGVSALLTAVAAGLGLFLLRFPLRSPPLEYAANAMVNDSR